MCSTLSDPNMHAPAPYASPIHDFAALPAWCLHTEVPTTTVSDSKCIISASLGYNVNESMSSAEIQWV